jgi:hypothetical protein
VAALPATASPPVVLATPLADVTALR